jgi:adenylate kinase
VVPENELVQRLATRRICSDCGTGADPFGAQANCKKCGGMLVQRTDDNREVVLERLKIYQQSTRPVLEFYRQRTTFRVVDGAQAPEVVARELDSMIDDASGRVPKKPKLRSDGDGAAAG